MCSTCRRPTREREAGATTDCRRYQLDSDDVRFLQRLYCPVSARGLRKTVRSISTDQQTSRLARTLCVAKITRPKEPVPKVTPASNWLINIGSGSFHSILR